jgi:hypothetical protein
MNVKRLLGLVPFVGRLVPSARDADDPATSTPFMVFFSFNLLKVVCWLMLLVSAIALIVVAIYTPGVSYFGSPDDRDAEIQAINSAVDLGVLKDKAAYDVSIGYDNGATATFVCYVALGTCLFMSVGSISGLLLVRWIKRHLGTIADEDEAAPMRASLDLLKRLRTAESDRQMAEGT